MPPSIIQSPASSDDEYSTPSQSTDNDDDNDMKVAASSRTDDDEQSDSSDMIPALDSALGDDEQTDSNDMTMIMATDNVTDDAVPSTLMNKRRLVNVKSKKKNKKMKAQWLELPEPILFDDVVVSYTHDTMPEELKK
jgi:hypothetical protein